MNSLRTLWTQKVACLFTAMQVLAALPQWSFLTWWKSEIWRSRGLPSWPAPNAGLSIPTQASKNSCRNMGPNWQRKTMEARLKVDRMCLVCQPFRSDQTAESMALRRFRLTMYHRRLNMALPWQLMANRRPTVTHMQLQQSLRIYRERNWLQLPIQLPMLR